MRVLRRAKAWHSHEPQQVAGFRILSVAQHTDTETFNFLTIEHAQCTKLLNLYCPLYSFQATTFFLFYISNKCQQVNS